MGVAPDVSRRTVVVDTCILFNFLHLDRLDLLGGLNAYDFVVCPEVTAEVKRADQRSRIEAAVRAGIVREVATDTLAALAPYKELKRILDPGEAAALALATTHCWAFATDDQRARKIAEQRIGRDRLMNTAGILVEAIRARLLSVEQADQAKTALEARPFKMPFASFRDVV